MHTVESLRSLEVRVQGARSEVELHSLCLFTPPLHRVDADRAKFQSLDPVLQGCIPVDVINRGLDCRNNLPPGAVSEQFATKESTFLCSSLYFSIALISCSFTSSCNPGRGPESKRNHFS